MAELAPSGVLPVQCDYRTQDWLRPEELHRSDSLLLSLDVESSRRGSSLESAGSFGVAVEKRGDAAAGIEGDAFPPHGATEAPLSLLAVASGSRLSPGVSVNSASSSAAALPLHERGACGESSAKSKGGYYFRVYSLMARIGAFGDRLWFEYCGVIVRRPRLTLIVETVVLFIFVGALYHPLSIDLDFSSFVKADGEATQKNDAYTAARDAREDLTGARRLQSGDGNENLLIQMDLNLIYKVSSGGNMAEERVLREVRDFELGLRTLPGWRSICYIQEALDDYTIQYLCNPGASLAGYAWPFQSVLAGSPTQRILTLNGTGSDMIPLEAVLSSLMRTQSKSPSARLENFFPDNFKPSLDNLLPTPPDVLRSSFVLFLTVPIVNGAVSGRAMAAAKKRYEEFAKGALFDYLTGSASKNMKFSKVYFYGDYVGEHELNVALLSDAILSIVSAAAVVCLLWAHVRSFALSVATLVVIILAVPWAYVLTPSEKTSMASFFALFLTLGVGSDFVFVLSDAWKQSVEVVRADMVQGNTQQYILQRRLEWALWHGGWECFATSITTAASFFSNLSSVLKPLREFSLFMGLCVMGAYLLVTLWVPPLLLIRDERRNGCCGCCCISCSCLRRPRPRRPSVVTPGDPGDALAVLPAATTRSDDTSVDEQHHRPASLHVPKKRTLTEVLLWKVVVGVEQCPMVLSVGAFLCLIAFVLAVFFTVQLDLDIPVVLPEWSNMVQAKSLQKRFTPGAQVDFTIPKPASTGLLRDLGLGPSAVATAGSYNWCRTPATIPAPSERMSTGVCWRSKTFRQYGLTSNNSSRRFVPQSVWDVGGCQSILVDARLSMGAGFGAPSAAAWTSFWGQVLLNLENSQSANTSRSVVFASQSSADELAPLIFENWETGEVSTEAFFQLPKATIVQKPFSNGSASTCTVEAVCFFGKSQCVLEGWSNLGVFAVGPPYTTSGEWPLPRNSSVGPAARRLNPSPFQATTLVTTVPPNLQFTITLVWGVLAPRLTPIFGSLKEAFRYDPSFDLANPWAQRALNDFCLQLPAELRVAARKCWTTEFIDFLGKDSFPTRNFHAKALAFMRANILTAPNLWVVKDRVVAARSQFLVDVSKRIPAIKMLEYKALWDDYTSRRNSASSATADKALHVADQWTQAEAEVAIMESTVGNVLTSIGSGFLGALVFTLNVRLAFLVSIVVIYAIAGLAFFIVVIMGWAIGPIEVISLIIFVGYSVTFALHFAHVFNQSVGDELDESTMMSRLPSTVGNRPKLKAKGAKEVAILDREKAVLVRKKRVRVTMYRVGTSTLSSALSTIGSSVPLLFCRIVIFTKLGAVINAITLLSLISGLVLLPALLIVVGPSREVTDLQLAGMCLRKAALFASRPCRHLPRRNGPPHEHAVSK